MGREMEGLERISRIRGLGNRLRRGRVFLRLYYTFPFSLRRFTLFIRVKNDEWITMERPFFCFIRQR